MREVPKTGDDSILAQSVGQYSLNINEVNTQSVNALISHAYRANKNLLATPSAEEEW